jgi:hypothetical protein
MNKVRLGDEFLDVGDADKEVVWDMVNSPGALDFADWLDKAAENKHLEARAKLIERNFEGAYATTCYAKAINDVAVFFREAKSDLKSQT